MAEFKIHSSYDPAGDQPQAIEELVAGIEKDLKHQVLLGITGSGKTFTMANVIQAVQKPTLILSHNKTLAAQLYGEFKSLFPENAVEFFISYYDYYQPEAYLPVTDTFIEKDMSMNEEIDRLRLKATTSLIGRKDVIIICSVSCIYGIGSPETYKSMLVHVDKSLPLDQKKFLHSLVNIHYVRNDLVLEPGTFRVRGDVIEVFPAYDEWALRIELFGDDVENIYTFHPLTGKMQSEFDDFWVYPAKHFVTTRENLNSAMDDIRVELSDRLKHLRGEGLLLEAQRLEQRTLYDLEMMTELGYCSGIENYSRFLSGRKPGEPPPTLFEYFPDNTLIFVDECHVTVPQFNGMYKGDRSRKSTLSEYGFRLPSCMDNRPLKFQEWDAMRTQTIFVSATPGSWELEQVKGKYVEQVIRPTGLTDPPVEIRPAKHQVDDLMHECTKTIEKNYRVLVTTLTKKMAEDLTEYLHENGIKVRYMHSDIDTLERIEIMRDLRLGVFDVLIGINLLREGLDIPECALVGILDADKEGFLRSETSLIQTIGRAARNIDSKVILYADKKTKSIKKAIQETDRRRAIQLAYNKKHKINATTIKKEISDVLESVYEKDYIKVGTNDNVGGNLKKHLKALNKRMKEAAANLEFEEAAKIRDEIRKLEATELEIVLNPKVKQYSLNNKVYPKGRSTMGMPGTRAKKGKKKWKQIK